MPSLFVIQGQDQGKRFELTEGPQALGRDTSNPIQLHDNEVSRRHAEIRQDGGQFTLVDLDSSNGTFVNSRRIQRVTLNMGDRVQLGRTLMIFTGGDEQSSAGALSTVDIISRQPTDGSRIIKSISQEEGSQVFALDGDSHSPWLARARSNLQVMYRTALAVSHTLDIDQLLHRIMDLIFEWVEADRGCVMLVEQETGELSPRVRRNRRGLATDDRMLISRTILDYVLEHQEGVLTSDAREDDRWDAGGSIVKLGVREAICVPLQGRYGVVGVIYIDTFTPPGRLVQTRKSDKFSEEHLKLMVAIGHQAALAVEDTSYYSALVQAERLAAMGQTIATLSHHIKNILQGIRGGSYLIEEGLKQNESNVVRKGWRIVEKNQEKISRLVMDMLTFSKEREPEFAPGNLNEVTAEVVELMQVRADETGARLEWRPDLAMPELTFDAHAMHQAILNVVTNAIDACERVENAAVTVSTRYDAASGLAAVEVRDNGEGIPAEDLTRIFSVFESRKGARGTGLGLPVSQKILREHQGEIRVESQPGQGSTFVLELPARTAQPPRRSPSTGDTLG
ncbi:MAG: FHA domain-containing protein [Pirellulaceae bacterium]|nr:FHA domain-containing protein [Pirellulaceae bacterium]